MRKRDNEIELTQYLRPNGKKRIVYAPVGVEYVKRGKGLILSCEELRTGQIAIYGRESSQAEEDEVVFLADNWSGENEPTKVLQKLIDRLRS